MANKADPNRNIQFLTMGSAPSTPNRESSDNNTSDNPWWQIENQILELNPNRMEDASPSTDPNSNSSDRSESDQQQQPQISNETEETLISTDNLECENSDGDESRIDVASATTTRISSSSSLNENENESSENGVVGSSNSSANANIIVNSSERGHSNERQQSLEEFKEELRIKREMRSNAIVELRNELSSLRQQLAHEKEINKQLIEERNNGNLCEICSSIYTSLEQQNVGDEHPVENAAAIKITVDDNRNNSHVETDAKMSHTTPSVSFRSQSGEVQFALQDANDEILRISNELAATRQQAKSLKEVIKMSKEIIVIRETELSQVIKYDDDNEEKIP